jgi:hypothetical protein
MSSSERSSRAARSSRGWVTVGSIAVVAVVVGAFVIGRVTSNADTAHASDAKTPVTSHAKRGAVTTTTIPTVNVDELAEARPDQPLSAPTRAQLAADLVVARSVAMQYPTVASARAAGMLQAGKFAPEVGAHFISYPNINREIRPDGTVDPRYPGGFIYDGISPTSKIVGLMYISLTDSPPGGFPGPNDHWHRHSNLCIQYGKAGIAVPFAPDRDVTRAQCDSVHGDFMPKTVWMVHSWVVPGWDSPQGVFSHSNRDLKCADGTNKTDNVGFCKGT